MPADLHQKMAEAMPPLSHLQCETCHTRRELTTADAGSYLASGWPTCCGYTMRLYTVAEVAAQRPDPSPSGRKAQKKGR